MATSMTSCILVIFGGTGDLFNRKLIPALYYLHRDKLLPENFALVAVARKEITAEQFRVQVIESLRKYAGKKDIDENLLSDYQRLFNYFRADVTQPDNYQGLQAFLNELDKNLHTAGNRIFYLAIAQHLFGQIVSGLHQQGLVDNKKGWQRVVIEKPFGRDLSSARQLNERISNVFAEDDIYRIDHYLGKEMIQNLMVIRFANILFEPVWNNKFIDNIQISSSETIGVEDRGSYYEQAGALRDMLQNHMLQLLAMVAMEPPSSLDTESIRDEKVKVFRSLKPLTSDEVRKNAVRGQYGQGLAGTRRLAGYRQEDKVSPESKTETFIALKLSVDNFRWAEVPFYLRTGKRMPNKSTEIVVQFKSMPEILFSKEYGELNPNLLVIRIQPREGVYVQLNAKKPGNKNIIVPVKMDFCQNCGVGLDSPEAYERLIFDTIRGDSTLFTRWDEVEHSWKFVDRIAQQWENSEPHFPNYAAGQWGPEAAQSLLIKDGRKWWNL